MPEQYRLKNAHPICKNAEEIVTKLSATQNVKRVYFAYKNSRIGCLRFGHGERLLIAFHGFGDSAKLFLQLQNSLESHYTVYAVDLPHHGHTQWREPFFNKRDIKRIISTIAEMENKYRFELMGYSFGARIIQRMVWEFAPRLDRLYLIAPDGFNTKGMFEISMIPRQIRYGLWRILTKPLWFMSILTFFRKHRLINQFIYDFSHRHLKYPERKLRLFSYWLSMDDFVIPMRRVLAKLNRIEIPIQLFFGENDPIIPVSTGKMLADELPMAQLHILNATHKLVTPELDALLKKILHKESPEETVEFCEPIELETQSDIENIELQTYSDVVNIELQTYSDVVNT
jgi:pimeloyl-ACP methyl ester carboxylesterase